MTNGDVVAGPAAAATSGSAETDPADSAAAPFAAFTPLEIAGPSGVTYRRFRGAPDIAGMVRTNMAARRHDGILEAVTIEGTAHRYAHLTNSDPARDVVVVEMDGEIVGFGRIEWADDNDGSRVYFSFCLLDPAVRGRGIGRPMLEWQERRIRAIATGHVTDRPRLFASSAWDGDPGAHALLTSAGYQVVRAEAEMVRPNLEEIPEAPAPAGIEIRPGRLADARLLWAADIEIFRDHWGAVDESEASYERMISDPTLDPSLWLIAWSGGEIAGLVLSSLQPGREPGTTLG